VAALMALVASLIFSLAFSQSQAILPLRLRASGRDLEYREIVPTVRRRAASWPRLAPLQYGFCVC